MRRFKPGDPVWARSGGSFIVAGEYPGVIYNTVGCGCSKDCYAVEVNGVIYDCLGKSLRPRRDDYQQHEGLGSRDQLDKPIASPAERSKVLGYILVPTGRDLANAP